MAKSVRVIGSGNKVCPKCSAVIGVRTKVCACKYVFKKPEKPEEKTEVQIISRGNKVCPECDAIVGVRTKICACEHVFSPKIKGWSLCKINLPVAVSRSRGGITLVGLVKNRLKQLCPGCLQGKCVRGNKQIQRILNDLIQDGSLVKDAGKYKVKR